MKKKKNITFIIYHRFKTKTFEHQISFSLTRPICALTHKYVHTILYHPIQGCVPLDEPVLALCAPGPCGDNADCFINDSGEDCQCVPGFSGNPYQVKF